MGNIITLYHGSEFKVEKPLFGKGKLRNDYGRGFYCTQDKELAKEWACQHDKNGFMNVYEMDIDGLNILQINENYSVLNWVCILLENRRIQNIKNHLATKFIKDNCHIDTSKSDIISGFRADDSYFAFAKDFVRNSITTAALEEALYLGNLGIQIVLKSEKALARIKFKRAEFVDSNIYYSLFKKREREANQAYAKIRDADVIKGNYIMDIVRNPELLKNVSKISAFEKKRSYLIKTKTKSDDGGMGR